MNRAMLSTAAARPSSRAPSIPTAKMEPATSQPRAIIEPASTPTIVRGSSEARALRLAASWIPRWSSHTAAATP